MYKYFFPLNSLAENAKYIHSSEHYFLYGNVQRRFYEPFTVFIINYDVNL